MPVLMVLSLLIQIAFVVHVIKTGREQMWIWIILFFPVVIFSWKYCQTCAAVILVKMPRLKYLKQLIQSVN